MGIAKKLVVVTAAFMAAAGAGYAAPLNASQQEATQTAPWTVRQVDDLMNGLHSASDDDMRNQMHSLDEAIAGNDALTRHVIAALPGVLRRAPDKDLWDEAYFLVQHVLYRSPEHADDYAGCYDQAFGPFLTDYIKETEAFTKNDNNPYYSKLESRLNKIGLITLGSPALVDLTMEKLAALLKPDLPPQAAVQILKFFESIHESKPGVYDARMHDLLKPAFESFKFLLTADDPDTRAAGIYLIQSFSHVSPADFAVDAVAALAPLASDPDGAVRAMLAQYLSHGVDGNPAAAALAFPVYRAMAERENGKSQFADGGIVPGLAYTGSLIGAYDDTIDTLAAIERRHPGETRAIGYIGELARDPDAPASHIVDALKAFMDDGQPMTEDMIHALQTLLGNHLETAPDILPPLVAQLRTPAAETVANGLIDIARAQPRLIVYIFPSLEMGLREGDASFLANDDLMRDISHMAARYGSPCVAELKDILVERLDAARAGQAWGDVETIADKIQSVQSIMEDTPEGTAKACVLTHPAP